MRSNSNYSRSLKGYLHLSMVSYRSSLQRFALILGGIIAMLLVGSAIAATYARGTGSASGGSLSGGMLAASLTLAVMGFSAASDKEMSRVFAFPMSRKVLLLGNFLVAVGVAFAFTYVMAIVGGLEAVVGRVLGGFIPRMFFQSTITLNSWILGFWISASYLAALMSVTYAVGMYFFRFKVPILMVGGAVLISFFVFPTAFERALRAFSFYFFETSPAVLSVKLWVTVLTAHLATILPLSRMEVRS